MTFWALGALDRVKNFSEKLGVKDYGTAIKNYITQAQQKPSSNDDINVNQLRQSNQKAKKQKIILSEQQKMAIQLRQYKKLLTMQDRMFRQHNERQLLYMKKRQSELQQQEKQLIKIQQQQKRQQMKAKLEAQLDSGTIQQVIQENILIKEKIYKSKLK